jgi:hypothetical protein
MRFVLFYFQFSVLSAYRSFSMGLVFMISLHVVNDFCSCRFPNLMLRLP